MIIRNVHDFTSSKMGHNTTNKSNINANHIIPSTNTYDAECLAKNKILYFHINWVMMCLLFIC